MQAFLDWFVFDRPLRPYRRATRPGSIAVTARLDERARASSACSAAPFMASSRSAPNEERADGREPAHRRELRRAAARPRGRLRPHRLLRGAAGSLAGQLPPLAGAHLPPARHRGRSSLDELQRQRREHSPPGVQDVIFTLSRMATRAEHYRNVRIEAIYDFARPPPRWSRPRCGSIRNPWPGDWGGERTTCGPPRSEGCANDPSVAV